MGLFGGDSTSENTSINVGADHGGISLAQSTGNTVNVTDNGAVQSALKLANTATARATAAVNQSAKQLAAAYKGAKGDSSIPTLLTAGGIGVALLFAWKGMK